MTNVNGQLDRTYQDLREDILAYVRSKTTDISQAEDVVQDAYLKLMIDINRGKVIRNPKGWLKKVSYNLLMDHYRSRQVSHKVDPENSASIDDQNDPHSPGDCLLGIIASLPYKYKKAVYLVDVKGMRQIDAAASLDIALPTFKSQVQRGRRLVKQGYVECCDYEIDEKGFLIGEAKTKEDCKVCSAA